RLLLDVAVHPSADVPAAPRPGAGGRGLPHRLHRLGRAGGRDPASPPEPADAAHRARHLLARAADGDRSGRVDLRAAAGAMTLSAGPGFFKELWTRLFEHLSRITYAHADRIVTIFEGNRQAQIRDGADPAKTLVVPNGINMEPLAALPRVEAPPG